MPRSRDSHPATAPYPRRWKALGVLALSLFVVTVGNTILNVGLPTIRDELGASASQLQWIVDGYLLVFAGLLLTAGSLGDRFGRRRALVTGLLVFGAGSLAATLSDSSATLIASRALMGLGAAGIMPTTLSILTNIFPAHERPKAIAIWAAVSGVGIAVGPITGGWLLEHFSWHSLFLVNLPIVAVALVGAAALVPESRDPEAPKLDLPGAGLSIAALTTIVWAVIEAPERGWGSSVILAAFALGLCVLAAFIAWERHTPQPMIDVTVFRNLRFSAASLSITFVFFALMGVLFFITTYMQAVLGYSALGTGLRVLPVAFGMVMASRAVGEARGQGRDEGGRRRRAGHGRARAEPVHAARRRHRVRLLRHGHVPDGRRHGPGHGARDRGDHGRAPEGQGRGRLGHERRRPRGRRDARRRGPGQRAQQPLRLGHERRGGRPRARAGAPRRRLGRRGARGRLAPRRDHRPGWSTPPTRRSSTRWRRPPASPPRSRSSAR